jgi:DNA-binding CsgD family transcriptional regulator
VRLLAAQLTICLAGPDADLDAAEAICAELAAAAERLGTPYAAALAARAQGSLLLERGAAAEALRRLRQAWGLWQPLGAAYEAAQTRVLVGRACRTLGDEDAARMELAAARAVFEELGAAPDVVAVDGLTAPAGAGGGGLSPRELEVLRLVATGATNRAIAGTLMLSEKTVARHVSNIFAKLGVPSRSAATAYAYEHDLA